MTYLVIYDQGYEGYSYDKRETLDELLEDLENDLRRRDIDSIYEIGKEIPLESLYKLIQQRAAAKTAAIQAARAKLTPEECELLGIA